MAECKVSQSGLCVTTIKQAEVKEGGSFSFRSTTCSAITRTRPDGTPEVVNPKQDLPFCEGSGPRAEFTPGTRVKYSEIYRGFFGYKVGERTGVVVNYDPHKCKDDYVEVVPDLNNLKLSSKCLQASSLHLLVKKLEPSFFDPSKRNPPYIDTSKFRVPLHIDTSRKPSGK